MEGFKLVSYFGTSSPCSHCYFLKNLICTFPNEKNKECKIEDDTHCGWNTKEYIKIQNIMNIAQILKDVPEGTKFYSPVKFVVQ